MRYVTFYIVVSDDRERFIRMIRQNYSDLLPSDVGFGEVRIQSITGEYISDTVVSNLRKWLDEEGIYFIADR